MGQKHVIDDVLWQAYASTHFLFYQDFNVPEYAIITAWNPKSRLLSYQDNRSNNEQLCQCFSDNYWAMVLAGDKAFEWVEESFAVAICLELALNLARQFEQNAIFYVRDETVFLHSCIDSRCDELGALSERIYVSG
ncbi:DUF3293 domain-containing protein [Vibrio mangrovi]|uniref:DUF3293 domain-containing protein n=1 Tax=Vibrio mangrovi TaxID=474394 RepID=A0A1Y6ITA0_9VIBR|nr:DUF3293 domain-containing protein [Vibrio mangrovi]MDW6001712.1 DUF3293 domain-containing protein [Vibrio mangrovi]SMS00261.1 hypothetical protein VIM7927_01510 [Vibrio mangrovi]